MQISAVIITFNEEENIVSCLESIKEIVDEIVIVDSFSTDKTIELVKKYEKVKCYSQKWLGYSEQKNYANSLTSYNTILSIDADEVLSEKLKESIKEIKGLAEDSFKIYEVSRLTNYCGSWVKHCGWYPDKKIRIFDKRVIKWQGEFVHETLCIPEKTQVIHLKGDLLHYSYKSSTDHIERINKYSSLTAKEAFKKGKTATPLDIWFRPKWRFFRDYIIKAGFLDGYTGYQVCKMSAYITFSKYIKLREYSKQGKFTK